MPRQVVALIVESARASVRRRLFDPMGQIVFPILYGGMIALAVLKGAPNWLCAIVGVGYGGILTVAALEWGVPLRYLHMPKGDR